jgi:hypothetical protein
MHSLRKENRILKKNGCRNLVISVQESVVISPEASGEGEISLTVSVIRIQAKKNQIKT